MCVCKSVIVGKCILTWFFGLFDMLVEWILINHCFISSHIGRICDCDWDADGNDYYDPDHDEIPMSINHTDL